MLTLKKVKKKRGRVYFDMDVQNAIIEYNDTDDDKKRNNIYNEHIAYAFDKLAENIINTFKFTYFDYGFEDIKCEVVAFLVMNMHKYDHTKGSKAFSYFSVVAKNYLILHNNNNYKKMKSHDDIDSMDSSELSMTRTRLKENKEYLDDFFDEIIRYFEYKIPTMFKKKRDIDIAYSIIELLKVREDIENFNKKSLYILIREMTGVSTNLITKVVNEMKKHYKHLFIEFETNGKVLLDKNNNLFF
tara:strand:+ start:322 stop:1053 length:732 start_codon:yes stop_codon:yes gene_type:complete